MRPKRREGQRVLPLMLVHGWPGSFFEFYKILPLLTETQDDLVFEVICPSIPGYGYSEAPHKQGKRQQCAHIMYTVYVRRC